MASKGLKATLRGSLVLAFFICTVSSVPQNPRLGRRLALVPPNRVVPLEEARAATLQNQNARQERQLSVRPPSRRVQEPLPSPVGHRNVKKVQIKKLELSPTKAEELQNSLPLNVRQGRQSAAVATQTEALRPLGRQVGPRPQKVVQSYGEQLQNVDKNVEFPNYDFKYQVHGGGNHFGHEESGRFPDKTTGQYHVLLPDGRRQIVKYYADDTGYHPTVTYELVPDFESTNKLESGPGYNRSKRSKTYRPRRKVRVVRRVRMRMPMMP